MLESRQISHDVVLPALEAAGMVSSVQDVDTETRQVSSPHDREPDNYDEAAHTSHPVIRYNSPWRFSRLLSLVIPPLLAAFILYGWYFASRFVSRSPALLPEVHIRFAILRSFPSYCSTVLVQYLFPVHLHDLYPHFPHAFSHNDQSVLFHLALTKFALSYTSHLTTLTRRQARTSRSGYPRRWLYRMLARQLQGSNYTPTRQTLQRLQSMQAGVRPSLPLARMYFPRYIQGLHTLPRFRYGINRSGVVTSIFTRLEAVQFCDGSSMGRRLDVQRMVESTIFMAGWTDVSLSWRNHSIILSIRS